MEIYEKPNLEIIEIGTDVIVTSCPAECPEQCPVYALPPF